MKTEHKGAVKVDESRVEIQEEQEKIRIIKCLYCGGTYGSNITLACPHCNAPVSISQAPEKVQNSVPEGIYIKDSNSDMV